MKNKLVNIALAVFSILITMTILELSARFYKGEFNLHNFLEIKQDLFRSAYPSIFHKELGWIPQKGNHKKNVWNTRVTILDDGIRANENNVKIESEKTILIVGDSFTFGDQVSNNVTWPAILENISKIRVINGGVFGYGVDQSFIRMKALATKYRPDIIIFSFFPDDINRCELSERTSVAKPYFEISADGDLILKSRHIVPKDQQLDRFRKIMGYSFLFHKLALRVSPEYWLKGSWKSTKVHAYGRKITCLIFRQLKLYAMENGLKIFILVIYDNNFERDLNITDEVILCIDQNILELIDLRTSFAELKKSDLNKFNSLFDGHLTVEGNRFVASIVFDAFKDLN